MIQYNAAARHISSSVGLIAKHNVTEGPDQWGKWSGRRYYTLEVTQHPVRARMCGFGDKDRRPLAPAAVAKLVVQNEDNSLVDLDDIDISFFVVTVDLWSEDAKQEMNLVLHPSSADRYPPLPQPPKPPRRRTNAGSVPAIPATPQMGPPLHRSNSSPSPAVQSISRHDSESEGSGSVPLIASYHTSSPYPPASQDSSNDNTPTPFASTFEPSEPSSHPTWGYGPESSSTPSLPPSSDSSDLWTSNPPSTKGDDSGTLSFRPWSSDAGAFSSLDFGSSSQSAESLWGHPSSSLGGGTPANDHGESSRFPSSSSSDLYSSSHQHQTPAYDPALYSSPYHGPGHFYPPSSYTHQHPPQVSISQQSKASAGSPPTPSNSIISPPTLPRIFSPPRHTYTRTLVGPLSANACRLLDEHRKPGIFFLFQDLSVRTEGTFRLRMRLMNIGCPSIPDAGATRVHSDVSPVLAQIYTEPFIVYSAKRFPGVPATTALSIAFGNQGQKLPIRNRHGSSKPGRRRRGGGSDGDSDDD